MVKKKTFSMNFTESDEFYSLSLEEQLLYFHLSMNSDNCGFVSNPSDIVAKIGANIDVLINMIKLGYLILFSSDLLVLRHWGVNNYIRADRKKCTKHKALRNMLVIEDDGTYRRLSNEELFNNAINDMYNRSFCDVQKRSTEFKDISKAENEQKNIRQVVNNNVAAKVDRKGGEKVDRNNSTIRHTKKVDRKGGEKVDRISIKKVDRIEETLKNPVNTHGLEVIDNVIDFIDIEKVDRISIKKVDRKGGEKVDRIENYVEDSIKSEKSASFKKKKKKERKEPKERNKEKEEYKYIPRVARDITKINACQPLKSKKVLDFMAHRDYIYGYSGIKNVIGGDIVVDNTFEVVTSLQNNEVGVINDGEIIDIDTQFHCEVVTDTANKDKDTIKPTKLSSKSMPPTLEEVKAYCEERNNGIDAEYFIASYDAVNWMRGKNKIVNWKACVITWEKNARRWEREKQERGNTNYSHSKNFNSYDNTSVNNNIEGDGFDAFMNFKLPSIGRINWEEL